MEPHRVGPPSSHRALGIAAVVLGVAMMIGGAAVVATAVWNHFTGSIGLSFAIGWVVPGGFAAYWGKGVMDWGLATARL